MFEGSEQFIKGQIARIEADNRPDLFIDPNLVSQLGDTGGSETLARIYRNQWTDWKNRFQPRLEQLAGYVGTGELTRQSVGLAENSMQNAIYSNARTFERNNERLGIQMTPAQEKAAARTANLTMAAATTDAMNRARIAGEDRDMQILAGGAGLQSSMKKELANS